MDDVAELCLGGVDKLTDKYFDYVYDNVDGWRRRRKGEPVQTKWERNENYRIRQANIKDDNNQNDNDNRGQEMQRSMPQQPQQRQPNGSQTRRYHYQPPLNAAYLREDEARPPPALPPPPYASYRKPNTQLRQRRSDDDIGYYTKTRAPPRKDLSLYPVATVPAPAVAMQLYQSYPQELDPRYEQQPMANGEDNQAREGLENSSSHRHSSKSRKHKHKDEKKHSSVMADLAGGLVGAYVGKKVGGGDKIGAAAGAAIGAFGAGAIAEKYKNEKHKH